MRILLLSSYPLRLPWVGGGANATDNRQGTNSHAMETVMNQRLSTLFVLPFLTLTVGCTQDDASALDAGEQVALDAAMRSLDGVRDDLPIGDQELEKLATGMVLDAGEIVACGTHFGIVSGVWYDNAPDYEGSWFEFGTGAYGGTMSGHYADEAFEGLVSGPDLEGGVAGWYGASEFGGDWAVEFDDGGSDNGFVAGVYESRNALGGYFFGIWTNGCDPHLDPASN